MGHKRKRPNDVIVLRPMLFAGWLLHSFRLAAALGLALLAMQAPAVTREYQAALLQLVRSSDQEIVQRKASAQRFYGISPGEDDGRFLSQLRAVEPSNAKLSPLRSIVGVACEPPMIESKPARRSCARSRRRGISPPMTGESGARSPERCSTVSRRNSTYPRLPRSTASSACFWARCSVSWRSPPSFRAATWWDNSHISCSAPIAFLPACLVDK